MSHYSLLVVLLFVFAYANGSVILPKDMDTKNRIVNGVETPIENAGYAVAIYQYSLLGGLFGSKYIGVGTFISKLHVITPCSIFGPLIQLLKSHIEHSSSQRGGNDPFRTIKVAKIHQHGTENACICELEAPVNLNNFPVTIASVSSVKPTVGTKIKICGYGAENLGGVTNFNLNCGYFDVIRCLGNHPDTFECVADLDYTGKATCTGDEGSAAVQNNIVYAMVENPSCGQSGPTILSGISSVTEWIQSIVPTVNIV